MRSNAFSENTSDHVVFFKNQKLSTVTPSLTTLNPNCLTLVENLPCSGPIYFPVLPPIIPCIFCFSYTTLFIISGIHPILTNTAFPHLHIFVHDIPSIWIPFPSLPIKIPAFKIPIPFKIQLKWTFTKTVLPPTPAFPIKWSLPFLNTKIHNAGLNPLLFS